MSRYYQVTFRERGTGTELAIGAQRNTRTAAERTARGKLHREHKVDTSHWFVVSTCHISAKEYDALERARGNRP